MNIFPAIDLFGGKAVRLFKGDYAQMTVYSEHPENKAREFEESGARYLHCVDLEGAKSGETDNIETVRKIINSCSLKTEIGGGVRSENVIKKYLDAGVYRVILGTAAVTEPEFLRSSVESYGEKIAVGVDIKDGFVAIKGWTETSSLTCNCFFESLQKLGVKTVICTDISKDGVMGGTNLDLYRDLSSAFSIDIIASGGVSSLNDIKSLRDMNIYGAILGKALYTGAVNLKEALALAKA